MVSRFVMTSRGFRNGKRIRALERMRRCTLRVFVNSLTKRKAKSETQVPSTPANLIRHGIRYQCSRVSKLTCTSCRAASVSAVLIRPRRGFSSYMAPNALLTKNMLRAVLVNWLQ